MFVKKTHTLLPLRTIPFLQDSLKTLPPLGGRRANAALSIELCWAHLGPPSARYLHTCPARPREARSHIFVLFDAYMHLRTQTLHTEGTHGLFVWV